MSYQTTRHLLCIFMKCTLYRTNIDDLVWLIAMCALMHSLETLTNAHSQCMYIKVSGHVLPRLTIP